MSLSASFAGGGAVFAFQKRQGRINWRRIGEVDLKRLISEVRLGNHTLVDCEVVLQAHLVHSLPAL